MDSFVAKYINGMNLSENIKKMSKMAEPSLTTVMQPGYEAGKPAMGLLIDEIKYQKSRKETFMLRTKLIVRNSSK